MSQIAYDSRAVTIDGRRTLLFSGAIHYPHSTPEMWPDLMRRSRAAGLNTIETYVFWNLHERRRGVLDFSDRLDLGRFCRVAAEHGMNLILRIGPYICAETNYGGIPPWMRDVPQMRMRTDNDPFKREMEQWVRVLCEYLRPMFAPRGGPIILAQIENEYANIAGSYGDDGQRYVQWAVDLSLSLNLGIPWIMCEGAAPGAIETLNGYFTHGRVEQHHAKHPDQPAIWTENWPGWYDTWGYIHHLRPAFNVAYSVAHFFGAGGTGVNYYMWHGGTHFGREAMYLQTTSYDFDAPLDEFGLETTKSKHLGRLHRVLADQADLLLAGPPTAAKFGERQYLYTYRGGGSTLAFFCNEHATESATVSGEGQTLELAPRSAKIVRDGQLLFDTAAIHKADIVRRKMAPLKRAISRFTAVAEPLASQRPPCVTAPQPIEQLRLTADETDYCWYSAKLTVRAGCKGPGKLELHGVGDVVHVFVDSKRLAMTKTPLAENRGKTDGPGFVQSFELALKPGTHELSLLCCAIGLIKGDWMLSDNMVAEKKGLWGRALWNGVEIPGPWTMRPHLAGEVFQYFGPAGELARPAAPANRPLRWLRATFARPKGNHPLALDLGAMTKGLAWLNGRCIGRYWLVPAAEYPLDEWQRDAGLLGGPMGVPTQRYYHLPAEWLTVTNSLVLFEEVGGDPGGIRLCQWK